MYEYLVTADEMRAFDNASINVFGIQGVVLMENAGRSTFLEIAERFGLSLDGLKVSVLAGPGNNGGDGFVIARYLINHGANVKTYLLSPRSRTRGDALTNLNILSAMGGSIIELSDSPPDSEAAMHWMQSDILIDAILGTGLKSEVRSPFKEAINLVNQSQGYVVSVDIPSGLNSDTGQIMGCAVRAHLTVTYGFRKLGMAVHPGKDLCGDVKVIDICIPRSLAEKNPPPAQLVGRSDAKAYFNLRVDQNAHKGTYGHALVVGGSPGKTGAPVMAARAASRIGAGLVTLAAPEALNQIFENKLTEEMTVCVQSDSRGQWTKDSVSGVKQSLIGKDCIIVGPGLSVSPSATRIVETILLESECPVVVDADGLNCITGNLEILEKRSENVIFTPHPGEMARLTGLSTEQIQKNRIDIARKFANEWNIWLVLKGAATIIASPSGQIFVNSSGNSWMASGGQGDALSGIIGGLLAQGLTVQETLTFGVFLHGMIADRIVSEKGLHPVLATDLIGLIPRYLWELSQEA